MANTTILTNVRIGKDIELKQFEYGQIATFSVADTIRVKKGDTYENKTQWFNIKAFGKTAEIIAKHHKKGDAICLSTHMQTDEYTDKQGNKKQSNWFIVDSFSFSPGNSKAENVSDNTQGDEFNDLPWT